MLLGLQRPITTILFTIEFLLEKVPLAKVAVETETKDLPKTKILVTILIEKQP